MQHHFDVELAKEYGILEAVLINNFQYWLAYNEANEKNFHDGYYWTYNSTKAYSELFPYVSERQIKSALKHLRDEGILQIGNYNKVAYDRTLWYSFTDLGKSIVQKCTMESTKMSNGKDNDVPPIPNNNSNNNSNNNKERKKEKKSTGYDVIINELISNDELKELLYEFIKLRKLKNKPLTDRALKIQINKLLKLSSDLEIQKKIIEKTIVKSWDEFYPYKEYDGGTTNAKSTNSTKRDGSEFAEYD